MSRLRECAPAVVTATALFGFPYALATTFGRGGPWYLLLAADLLVLVAVAILVWSPLVVLVAAVVSAVFAAIALLGVSFAGTCGTSDAAETVELVGGVLVGVAILTWGVRRGPRALWALSLAWVAYGVWIVVWAHLIPGGAGGCFE